MSNEITDPYEKILQNMREYPNDIPITIGRLLHCRGIGFLKHLENLFPFYLLQKKQKLLSI